MIGEVTGIHRIRMLYLQLLYRCNFECPHCFHGERLQHADAFTLDEAISLMTLMRDDYGTEAVTLLGGEPFVYKHLGEVVRYAKQASRSRSAPTATESSGGCPRLRRGCSRGGAGGSRHLPQ
ncbi:radical SAM protein [Streptomyces sp. TRM68367]|uniref:radical SAM protein n=1 Tax=Streptomyces sp. TRM68367 TaxID=2758415 RepID=UPI0029345826|nr:radical SAM protein [Streptomyces sp. TRM68367]